MLTPLSRGKFFGLPALRQSDILAHLGRATTIYYTSRRSLNEALLMFDFDWHDKHKAAYGDVSDAVAAARFIQMNLFPLWKTYVEPSTGGYGAHLFVRTDCNLVASRILNADLRKMTERIRQMVAAEGFLCDFCGIYGNFTVIENGIVAEKMMGALAKLPRPLSEQEMLDLMGIDVIPYTAFSLAANDAIFEIILDDLGGCGPTLKKSSHSLDSEAILSHPVPDSAPAPGTTGLPTAHRDGFGHDLSNNACSARSTSRQQDIYCADNIGSPDPLERLRQIHNPNQRIFESVFLQARKLNRPPSIDEAVQFYESHGLNTGTDVKGRRFRRAKDAVRSCQASFRPLQRQGVLRFLPLVRERLTESDLRSTGSQRVVTFQDVAVGLYIMTGRIQRRQANPKFQYTVGRDYVIAGFRNLKARGLYDRLCDRGKRAAIKRLLLQAGFIEYVHGPGCYRTGRSEEFKFGPHHPYGSAGTGNAPPQSWPCRSLTPAIGMA